MAIEDIVVVSVPVSDQDRAKAFYVDKLGFDLLNDVEAEGIHWVEVAPKSRNVSLTLVTWFESMPPGSLQGLVLSTKDARADYEELKSRGVPFDGPPKEQPWGTTEAVLRDPDGNMLVLQQGRSQ